MPLYRQHRAAGPEFRGAVAADHLRRPVALPGTALHRLDPALPRPRVRPAGCGRDRARLAAGITVDGEKFGPIQLQAEAPGKAERGTERSGGSNTWLTVSLKEGKNREVRRALQEVGHSVSRLIRTAYGPFQLGQLARGATKEAPRRVLREAPGRRPAGGDRGRPHAPRPNEPRQKGIRRPGARRRQGRPRWPADRRRALARPPA